MQPRLNYTMLTEQHHPQPKMCLRLIWPERQHPLIFRNRLSRMACGGEHVRQVLMYLGIFGLQLRCFTQFGNCTRCLIHQHQQPAQVMVRLSKISIGRNGLLKLKLGFRVAVLVCQQTAKIVSWPRGSPAGSARPRGTHARRSLRRLA